MTRVEEEILPLPADVEPDSIKATSGDGVLEVAAPVSAAPAAPVTQKIYVSHGQLPNGQYFRPAMKVAAEQ